jgi:hypothetical protein
LKACLALRTLRNVIWRDWVQRLRGVKERKRFAWLNVDRRWCESWTEWIIIVASLDPIAVGALDVEERAMQSTQLILWMARLLREI